MYGWMYAHTHTHVRTPYITAHDTARANPNKSHAHSLYLRGGQGLSQHVVQFQRDSSGQVAVGPSCVGVIVPLGPVIIIIIIIIIITTTTTTKNSTVSGQAAVGLSGVVVVVPLGPVIIIISNNNNLAIGQVA